MRQLRSFKDILIEDLQDSESAKAYLCVALEEYEKDRDSDTFLLALRDVAEAKGGLSQLAKKSHLNRQNLHKALSKKGNPRFDTVETILHGLGFRLSIEAMKEQKTHL